ncbi:bifunctional serine/threonine-protein kinase/ABC transporter substrate-binding protein [Streptomyces flavovirens]
MRPLTSQDPRAIGAYRPLARLGAGGMGVVYLARGPGGDLAAVKVIHAEHAADPGFRARFRREAEAARSLDGPWAVPVAGADTEAREPWLATEFVPGPSLAEAVGERGPLPEDAVRALGTRLARALADAHAAELVHRDVKPGNVLLARDGPRLIDFGIARHAGATALTATGALLGTPGYLAPEQATAGETGPACDVFALGCVLVYAATGHRPFGDGSAAGVLFRTVHEDPDLAGMPPGLLAAVTACLAKAPGDRPTAREARALLSRGGPDTGWHIPGLTAELAERSAAALALPDPGPPPAPPSAPAGPAPPSRRRFLAAGAAGAVLLAGGGTAAWIAARRSGGAPEATRGRPTYTIGLHADLSGPGKAVGLAHRRGAQLAVDGHNARAAAPFRLALRAEDDTGTAAGALRVAERLAAAREVIAVVGPTTDVTPEAVVTRYAGSRLATVVVAAGAATKGAAETLCVLRPFDADLPTALIDYLAHVRPAERIRVIEDRSPGAGGWEITEAFRDLRLARVTVDTVRDGFGAAARAAVTARADAVVFAGTSPARAARCAVALAEAGYAGTRVSSGPALSPVFLRDAGDAGDGWVFAEAYCDPAATPAAAEFTAAHRARFGAPPDRWAAEAYDAVGLIARAAETTSAAAGDRGGIARRLFLLTYQGISRPLSFRTTRRVRSETGMFLYRAEGGRARFLGPYAKL